MFKESIAPVWMRGLLANLLAALPFRPAAGLAVDFECHLYTAGPSPITPLAVPADFTEATFGGYAAVGTLNTGTPFNSPSGDGLLGVSGAQFFADSTIVPPGEVILGYYITNTAGTVVLWAEEFDTPVPIVNDGDFIDLAIALPLNFINDV